MPTSSLQMRDLLVPAAVITHIDVTTKKDVLLAVSAQAATLLNRDAHVIFDTLWEREKLGSTGVGHGIAIPHGRLEKLEKVCGLFVRLSQPIAFESIDDKPVDLIFLLLAPESAGADHLHALSAVSRLLRNATLCDQIRTAKDEAAIYRLLTEAQSVEAA